MLIQADYAEVRCAVGNSWKKENCLRVGYCGTWYRDVMTSAKIISTWKALLPC